MRLLFYSAAVIAVCIIAACNSSAKKQIIPAQDVTLSNAKPESQTANGEGVTNFTPPKIVQDEEKKSSATEDANSETADTISDSFTPPDATVLQAGTPINNDWEKKIIKTAKLTLELKDYTLFNSGIHDKLQRFGAYIASEQQSENDARIENSVTIKVPVEQFEDLMNTMGGDGIKVLEKNISTEDVTGEMVDTKARMEAKKEVRDKYMELLKSAKTMKDILAVQDEINTIQEDLEAATGRVNYLSHNAAYSTINLDYYQYINGNTADSAEPTFFTKLKDAFAAGGAVIINLVLFLISVWPLVIAGVLLLLYIKKYRLKKA